MKSDQPLDLEFAPTRAKWVAIGSASDRRYGNGRYDRTGAAMAWFWRIQPGNAAFPHAVRGFSVRYLASHASLHFYNYPGVMRIGARQYNLRPGDVTVTGPGVSSSYDLPAPGFHLCIHFTLPPAD